MWLLSYSKIKFIKIHETTLTVIQPLIMLQQTRCMALRFRVQNRRLVLSPCMHSLPITISISASLLFILSPAMHAGHHYTDSTVSEASAPPLPPPTPPFPLDSYDYTTAPTAGTTGFPVITSNHQDGINQYPPIPSPPPPMPPPMPPPIVVNPPSSPQPWSTGLCDCFTDCPSCCLTFWCPCVTFGRIAEIVDRGSNACGVSGTIYGVILCLTGWSCLYSCFYRSKLRGQFFLEESPCVDCCVHCWCEGCALCQEYRELQNRGFDLSIGWHGNMERQRREGGGGHVNPVRPHQGMTRDR